MCVTCAVFPGPVAEARLCLLMLHTVALLTPVQLEGCQLVETAWQIFDLKRFSVRSEVHGLLREYAAAHMQIQMDTRYAAVKQSCIVSGYYRQPGDAVLTFL